MRLYSDVSMVFHPCFSPSNHSRPAGVLLTGWQYDHVGLGCSVNLVWLPLLKGGSDILVGDDKLHWLVISK